MYNGLTGGEPQATTLHSRAVYSTRSLFSGFETLSILEDWLQKGKVTLLV